MQMGEQMKDSQCINNFCDDAAPIYVKILSHNMSCYVMHWYEKYPICVPNSIQNR